MITHSGALARQIADFDWSKTPLGAISTWPQSRLATISNILHSPLPKVTLWGEQGVMVYNDAYAGFAGKRHPELLGMPVLDAWPEAADLNRNVMATVWRDRGTLTFKDQHLQLDRDSDGPKDLWCDLYYSPILGEKGNTEGVLAIVIETTARVRAEQARQAAVRDLEISELFSRSMIESSPDCIKVLDIDGNILSINQGGLRQMEIDDIDACVGRAWIDIMSHEGARLSAADALSRARNGETVRFEGYCETAKATPKWWEVMVAPIKGQNGDVYQLLSISRDITEREQVAQTMRQEQERLQFLNALENEINMTNDPFATIEVITQRTCNYFGASRCVHVEINEDQDGLLTRYEHVQPGIDTSGKRHTLSVIGDTLAGKLRAGQMVIVDDVPACPVIHAEGKTYLDGINVKAFIAVPIIENGVLKAVFALHQTTARAWTDDEAAFLHEITDKTRVHLEKLRGLTALRESEQHFRAMADSMAHMIWVTRPDGYHEYYNRRWYEFTGVPEGSTDGEAWNGVFHPEDQEHAWKVWRHSLETGEPYQIEYRLRRHDGTYCWVLGRAMPSYDENGAILKWYGTCTDIEEQKRTQDMLAEARQQAEQASIAKTEFLTNMSHEIRTPMNAVIGISNILAASSPLTDQQRQFIKTLQLSADQLLALINDLLDIAKIEARTVELEAVPFNLAQMLQEVISMTSVRGREKGLSFSVESDVPQGRQFIGDPARLRQIILNLCSNAVKFTEEGGVRLTVHVEDTEDPSTELICINVIDTGIGIAPENVENIFHKFVQADSSINRKYGGTGLGLAITKTLAEIMGGTISVKSHIGEGSTFTVCVPLGRLDGDLPLEASKAVRTRAPMQDDRKKILLVEDYAPNILVAGAFLEQFGYEWDSASNGVAAVEHACAGGYAAILMDVQMHGMNGFEATRLIRAHEEKNNLPRVPIIGMTAHALAGDRERCLGVGMDDYISKPFDPDALETMLADMTKDKTQNGAG